MQVAILVATDVAGRGIHVRELAFVINYDFPAQYVLTILSSASILELK